MLKYDMQSHVLQGTPHSTVIWHNLNVIPEAIAIASEPLCWCCKTPTYNAVLCCVRLLCHLHRERSKHSAFKLFSSMHCI